MLTFAALALLVSTQAHPAHGIRHPAGRLFVVGGPGGLPSVQSAIDDASDGDSILVKQGVYPGFVVSNTSLSIVAESGPRPEIHGPILIESLAAGKTVFLAGLLVGTMGDAPPLTASFDLGSVRVAECRFAPLAYPYDSFGQSPVVLDHAADVEFVSCELISRVGGIGYPPHRDGWPGPTALQVLSSSVALQNCGVTGGDGGAGDIANGGGDGGTGGSGGDGVLFVDGFVDATGSQIYAGAGGAGGDNGWCFGGGMAGNGGTGGTGVRVSSSASSPSVVLLGTLVVAGAAGRAGIDHSDMGGSQCWGDGLPGSAGSTFVAAPGDVQSLAGAPRGMTAPRVAREGQIVTAQCIGRRDDVVQILASDATQFAYDPQVLGVRLIPPAQSVVLATGTIPASGSLDLVLPLPAVAKNARPVYLQAYFVDRNGQGFAGTQVTVLELDSRY